MFQLWRLCVVFSCCSSHHIILSPIMLRLAEMFHKTSPVVIVIAPPFLHLRFHFFFFSSVPVCAVLTWTAVFFLPFIHIDDLMLSSIDSHQSQYILLLHL
ncbi:hypothetical protein BV22DRAFT_488650 [Leucogyrophana mollusca]|uniref:Uncharacterized protein n=1 Tax=Leucogyrophana mollusca TaxID=85980 RepID=A0ACB8BHI6_9AGAM|nr:hypothetical protein BV22DRAFT_488650 [Leucogyrophana mollusca]